MIMDAPAIMVGCFFSCLKSFIQGEVCWLCLQYDRADSYESLTLSDFVWDVSAV